MFKPGSKIEYRNGIYECDGFATDVYISEHELMSGPQDDIARHLKQNMIYELAEQLIKQKVVSISRDYDPATARHRVMLELNVLRKLS